MALCINVPDSIVDTVKLPSIGDIDTGQCAKGYTILNGTSSKAH